MQIRPLKIRTDISDSGLYWPTLLSLGLLIFQLTAGTSPSGAQEMKRGWQQEWERTVEAAKKEGQVNVYMWSTISVLDAGAFQKEYPGIKVLGVSGRRGQIENRIFTERRAGKYLADIITHGVNPNATLFYPAGMLAPIKSALILPEVLDKSKWWNGKHYYADPEKKHVFVSWYVFLANGDVGTCEQRSHARRCLCDGSALCDEGLGRRWPDFGR